jgi:hypothetical protein
MADSKNPEFEMPTPERPLLILVKSVSEANRYQIIEMFGEGDDNRRSSGLDRTFENCVDRLIDVLVEGKGTPYAVQYQNDPENRFTSEEKYIADCLLKLHNRNAGFSIST